MNKVICYLTEAFNGVYCPRDRDVYTEEYKRDYERYQGYGRVNNEMASALLANAWDTLLSKWK